jgi:hypothetical protein
MANLEFGDTTETVSIPEVETRILDILIKGLNYNKRESDKCLQNRI